MKFGNWRSPLLCYGPSTQLSRIIFHFILFDFIYSITGFEKLSSLIIHLRLWLQLEHNMIRKQQQNFILNTISLYNFKSWNKNEWKKFDATKWIIKNSKINLSSMTLSFFSKTFWFWTFWNNRKISVWGENCFEIKFWYPSILTFFQILI